MRILKIIPKVEVVVQNSKNKQQVTSLKQNKLNVLSMIVLMYICLYLCM